LGELEKERELKIEAEDVTARLAMQVNQLQEENRGLEAKVSW
jgi:hypothetical protein